LSGRPTKKKLIPFPRKTSIAMVIALNPYNVLDEVFTSIGFFYLRYPYPLNNKT
jgi:hypothetical protein